MSDGKSKPLPPAVEGKMVVEKLGETIRNHLAQATAAERTQCLDQLSAWVADREKEDRDKYNARVARGEPAPSAYTPPYTCKPVPASATSSDTKDPTFEPREDAAGLRASHRQSLRFVHSCCLLRMSWWATHSHGGCRHLCRDLGRTYQVSSASYAAGCYAVDTHWVRCCLQDWKAVVVPPPRPTILLSISEPPSLLCPGSENKVRRRHWRTGSHLHEELISA